jgi:hypothetical protein
LCITGDKFGVILAQLRHVRAAEGSGKAAIKNQQDIRFIPEIRK